MAADMQGAFDRVRSYQERTQGSRAPGFEQYGKQLQSVRDAYWKRIQDQQMKALEQRLGSITSGVNGGIRAAYTAVGGGGYQGPVGPMNNIKRSVSGLARSRFGWTGAEWAALDRLVQKESSWNPRADNPTSTAYGLFQFLDSTRRNYNLPLNANVIQQAMAGLQYIKDRYGSPSRALAFHNSHNWY